MANHKSSKKRIRRNQARAEINKSRVSRIRTFIKKVESAIGSGDAPAANQALKEAQPEIMRGVSKGVLHKNTASRKMSRLAASVKKISVNAA
ncbi:30S ribosomal protein S20 [Alphaproteobacteria bacterium]|jgi:small subunit ribosomal protein S20|nr:30S ribosomal protein S20 [Alphaproteobacteria bacterium]MBT5799928.1 30S ribosomal protein S20 [Alphaproteobacteria bacterium]MDA9190418.1 30S ribosomal protein S20 [Alphaproteobacteria bacterium]MDA9816075.1 30S ribosomal protein S20 [Alphaproteobacteria bacterium]MDC3311090.1 30S ribosomal protein S20 [Alphaproteobacteria bacterium]